MGYMLTGRVRDPGKPAANCRADARQGFTREGLKCNKLSGVLYGRLLTAVAIGSLGNDRAAVSTVLVHGGPVQPETVGNRYLGAFQALKTKHEVDTNHLKPWDLGRRLG